jgi:hypothetical protein
MPSIISGREKYPGLERVEGWGYHGPDLKGFQPSLGMFDGKILD